MRERPILFSGPMVRAILEGRKTQTRRVVKARKSTDHLVLASPMAVTLCPCGQPGDRLWVKETFGTLTGAGVRTVYRADGEPSQTYFPNEKIQGMRWRPSIHMPRHASRITLEVTDVRVERLQDISEEDAKAEGVTPLECLSPDQVVPGPGFNGARLRDKPHRLPFADLWESIHGEGQWDANPWVWVVEFKRLERQ